MLSNSPKLRLALSALRARPRGALLRTPHTLPHTLSRASSTSHSSVIRTAVQPSSEGFIAKAAAMSQLEVELGEKLARIEQGGGQRAVARVRAAGRGDKWLARERSVESIHCKMQSLKAADASLSAGLRR